MSHYTLTSIDTTSIQRYIFGSNALPENIGASQLVERAIGVWLDESLPKPYTADGIQRLEESPTLRAEVIMRGGGNALILFREHNDAVETIKRLSRTLLCEAPGLEIAVAHQTFDWNQEALGGDEGVINQLAAAVNQRKQQRASSAAVFNLSVLAECRATRQPVVDVDRDDTMIAAEVQAKLDKNLKAEAEQVFAELFESVIGDTYTFVRDVEDLNVDDDRSHLAVVHADGNGIGQRFINLVREFSSVTQNRACLTAMRDLSQKVDKVGKQALEQTLARLEERFKHKRMQRYVNGLKRRDGKYIIPFRPLILGGDDVTFVCDGPLGLGLAVIFLEEFERAAQTFFPDAPIYACAGVVIFKTHYPFSRAYELCEDLCKKTKTAMRKANLKGSGLDWHISMSGISGEISAIRKREYEIPGNNLLTIRPLSLHAPGIQQSWHNWQVFASLAEEFGAGRSDDEIRRDQALKDRPRNKVKALREALREGSGGSESFIRTAGMKLPPAPTGDTQHPTTGWSGKYCVYFDVIEALDFYLPLDRMEVE